MLHPRRRDASIGVYINRSSQFSVGAQRRDDEKDNKPQSNPLKYQLRTYTGQVLEGVMPLPGRIQGDLVWGTALVQRDGEASMVTARRDGNAVRFDDDDFEAVNGAQATVSYLTAI